MAGNTLTLDFAGDATKLQKAAKQASSAIEDIASSAKSAGEDFDKSSKKSGDFTDKIGKLGAGVTGMSDAIDNASGLLDTFSQIQQQSYETSQRQKRALQDVHQAQQDYNQAVRDSRQAAIDAGQAQVDKEQADLDAKTTLAAYNDAVKKHGKNSDEAKQALIDYHQAQQDQKQAVEDSKQATEDGKQATLDAAAAQLDLNDAQKEANPPDLDKWSQQIQTYAPLLSGLIGIISLVTAIQWAWNAAQLASPTTWIVLAVLALIAVIVLIVTHLDTVKKVWGAVWGWIKDVAGAVGSWFKDTLWGKWIKGAWDLILDKAKSVWGWMKDLPGKLKNAFLNIADVISKPFRSAFNFIADAWNNTIGRLSWSIPSWIPGIGGNSISVPRLPKFHTGGVVPGTPGSEMLAVLQAGETVIPAGGTSGTTQVTVMLDAEVLVTGIARQVRRRGGDVQFVLGGANA